MTTFDHIFRYRGFAARCFGILLCLLLFCTGAKAVINKGHILTTLPAVKDSGGAVFDSTELQGKYSLFAFFSIYSESSDDLFTFLDRVQAKYARNKSFQILGVNVDPGDESVSSYLKTKQSPFRVLLDVDLALSNRFGIKQMPTFFIIAPDGKVVESVSGFSPSVTQEINSYLQDLLYKPENNEPTPQNDHAARIDDLYKEKKLISTSSPHKAYCANGKSLLLYISSDHILWTFDALREARKEIATDVETASWSPDCKAIVFSNNEKSGIWIKHDDGTIISVSPEGDKPAWSPTGDMIAFVVDNVEIWVFRLSTQKRWRIAVNGNSIEWSPDGTLLLVQDDKQRLWLISPFSRFSLIKGLFNDF